MRDIGFQVRLNTSFDEALSRVTAALKEEGFGVLTTIDVKETLKQKLNVDFRRYVILGACNPSLSHRALNADLDLGLLLPCNVIVYEQDGGAAVSLVDPQVMLGVMANPAVEPIANEARGRLRRVAEKLGAGA